MPANNMNREQSKRVSQAIEVFVRGFAITKSRTHPYDVDRIDGVWVMRDAERKQAKDYRKEEWIGFEQDPKHLIGTARANTRGRHFLGVLVDDDALTGTRDGYRALGYRLLSTEPFFIHDLKRIPRCSSPAEIVRMSTQQLSQAYAKIARIKPLPDEYLAADSTWRHYLAMIDSEIVGWVSSIRALNSSWCSNLVVRPAFRRKGIGSALLSKMLRDDRARGAAASVLLSTHVGAALYPQLGYRQYGTLLILAPMNKAATRLSDHP